MMKALAAAAAMLSIAAIGDVHAQGGDMSPMIAVPDGGGGGGGGGIQGCWRVRGTIYGPYRFSFCLRGGGGTYEVTGGGLNCNGRLDWYPGRKERVEIDLYRSQCGRGTSWTGDSLSCRIQGWRPFVQGGSGKPKVAVPAPGGGYDTMNCTYNPVAGGYSPIQVTARRL